MNDYSDIRTTLEEKLSTLVERAGGIETILRDPGEKDWEENSLARENDETLVALGSVTETEIRDIRTALERIKSGDYGQCVDCHKPIAKARLLALPWATKCIHCAS